MQIAGIEKDDLADGSGKAPLTWISKELLLKKQSMNSTSCETESDGSYIEGTGAIGGWEKSHLRAYLIETVKPLIPELVRAAIKTVIKTQTAYNTSGYSFNQTTQDDVWVPSEDEVSSYGRYGLLFPDNASRVKSVIGASSASSWWVRNISSRSEKNYFYSVSSSGTNSIIATATSYSLGTALGFCT